MLLKHHRPSKQLHSCRGRVTSSSDPLWSGKSIWRPTDFIWQVDDSTPTSKIPRWNSIWTKRTLDDHVINGQQQSVLPKLQALLVSSTRICMPASLWTLSLCRSQSGFLDRNGRFLQTESLPVYQSQNYPTLFFHDSMCHFQHVLFELTWAWPCWLLQDCKHWRWHLAAIFPGQFHYFVCQHVPTIPHHGIEAARSIMGATSANELAEICAGCRVQTDIKTEKIHSLDLFKIE